MLYELFPDIVVRFFIDDAPTIQLGSIFLRIASLAIPFVIINFQMCFVFQALGKVKQAMLLSCFRQGIIYIPLLFLLNSLWGVYGLMATQLISDIITLFISLWLSENLNHTLKLKSM